MNRVRMILVVACVLVVVALAALIFVLTRGDNASPSEPRVETAQTKTAVPKDKPIVVVPKDTGQPAPPANETDGPKEDAIEEPPDEAEPPESPEEKERRLEVEHKSNKAAVRTLRERLDMTLEQLEGVPDAVVEQFAAKMRRWDELMGLIQPDLNALAAMRERVKREGTDHSRVEELRQQLCFKHEATFMRVCRNLDEAVELMRPYLNGEQLPRLDAYHRHLELQRQRFLAGHI